MLVFSKNGIEKTTPSERFSIAGRVAVQAKKLINIYGAKDTIEFFQDFGQGYLLPAQSELIAAERQKNKDFTNVKVNIGLRNWVAKIFVHDPLSQQRPFARNFIYEVKV